MSVTARERVEAVVAIARAHPRHLGLAALVAGLLSATAWWTLAVGLLAVLLVGRDARVTAVALLALSAGAAWGQERISISRDSAMAQAIGESLTGRVVALEAPRSGVSGTSRFRVRWLDGPVRGDVGLVRIAPAPDRDEEPPSDAPSASSILTGTLLDVSGRVVALEEWESHQRRRGIHAALAVQTWRVAPGRRAGLSGLLDAARDRSRVGLTTGAGPSEAALLRGMVLGEDEAVPATIRDAFRASGLAHLLAVSGQNVMLLAVLAIALASALGASLRARLAVALALVLAYVPLAGGGPSIQRAGVMGAAGLVAALAGRPADRWYALLLAGALTLAANPLAVGDPGWQLSFAAVIALLAGAGPATRALQAARVPRPVAEVVAITVLATAATAPLLVHHFGELSLVSLPANVLAAPAVAPLMWLGMLAAGLAQFHPALAVPLTWCNAHLVAYVEWVAHAAAAVPHATVTPPAGAAPALALAIALGVAGVVALARRSANPSEAIVAWRRRAPKSLALSGICAAALVATAAVIATRNDRVPIGEGELLVSFLDVGQGDATLLQSRRATVLFDTGPPDGPILRRLDEAGVERLDALVLTHAQADHEGAAVAVVHRHRPRLVLNGGDGWPTGVQRQIGAAGRQAGSRVIAAYAGQALVLDGIRVKTLWPPHAAAPDTSQDPNQTALVAHVRHGRFDLLLPADAESGVLRRLDLPAVEALKVSHHGSEDAGLPHVLERLRPAVAAIEVGRGNSYGHPAPSTLAALSAVPEVVRTDSNGTVRLHVRGDAMELKR